MGKRKKKKKKVIFRILLLILLGVALVTVILFIAQAIIQSLIGAIVTSVVKTTPTNRPPQNETAPIEPNKDKKPVGALYPSNHDLKRKAQILEMCEDLGKQFNINPDLIFYVAYTESKATFDFGETNKDAYQSLLVVPEKDRARFSNKDIYNGKVVDTSTGAISPFQIECKYIDTRLKYYYIPSQMTSNKIAQVVETAGHMTVYDKGLGFNRPHPYYMPDLLYNTALSICSSMENHRSLCETDKRWESLPKDIQDLILFIYAGDNYRGDMKASGKNGNQMHDNMVSFFIDVYEQYGKLVGFNSNDRELRAWLIGTQKSNDWYGVIEGKVNIDGKDYQKSLLESISNGKYLNMFLAINNNGGSMNKFGLAYAFEGMNGGFKVLANWRSDIKIALEEENGSDFGGSSIGEYGFYKMTDLDILPITSQFGCRRLSNVNGVSTKGLHNGIDIAIPLGTPLYAVADGIITDAGNMGSYGYTIQIEFKINTSAGEISGQTRYAHLDETLNTGLINAGDTVKAGQLIAYSGNSGLSSGPHLHWYVRLATPQGKWEFIHPLTVYGMSSNTKDIPNWAALSGFTITHDGQGDGSNTYEYCVGLSGKCNAYFNIVNIYCNRCIEKSGYNTNLDQYKGQEVRCEVHKDSESLTK